MFTAWLVSGPAAVLCGYKALRDALVLQADALSGHAMAVFERFTQGNCEAQGATPAGQNGRGLVETAAKEGKPLGLCGSIDVHNAANRILNA